MNDYSQHGEGKWIYDFFKNQNPNNLSCLSIGENDGKTLSNVLGVIELGWKAYLIEPCEVPFKKMVELHKDNHLVTCYNYAIAKEDGFIDIYESGEHLGKGDTSLLSTTIQSEMNRWKGTEKFVKKQVKAVSVYSFLIDCDADWFDLISIDAEGLDFFILNELMQSHTISNQTKMIIVETNSVDDFKYIDLMAKHNFRVFYKNFCNIIFVKNA